MLWITSLVHCREDGLLSLGLADELLGPGTAGVLDEGLEPLVIPVASFSWARMPIVWRWSRKCDSNRSINGRSDFKMKKLNADALSNPVQIH